MEFCRYNTGNNCGNITVVFGNSLFIAVVRNPVYIKIKDSSTDATLKTRGEIMYRKLLTKKFFRDNPHKEFSVQQVLYSTLLYDGIEQVATEYTLKHMLQSGERGERIAQEKQMIRAEQNPEVVFQLLRKNIDVINRTILIDKALGFEDKILPLVIEKLKRSDHDVFIENAIRILAKSKKNYSPILMERYAEFRSPYVRSLLCLILGFRGEEDTIPWMMDRYFETKKRYPDDTYDQGPLIALSELNARFYID